MLGLQVGARYRELALKAAHVDIVFSHVTEQGDKNIAPVLDRRLDGGIGRLDAAREAGLTPGIDPEGTPACVNSCLATALSFGDIEDPESSVSRLLAENQSFRMHEELGTEPGFYYLWEKK